MYSTLLCEWRSITDSIHIKGFTFKKNKHIMILEIIKYACAWFWLELFLATDIYTYMSV